MKVEIKSRDESHVLRFRTGAAIATRLGSEQLKDEVTAVLELVKNAYDADATDVLIVFLDDENGQRIKIIDNGTGMSVDDLKMKWAWLATENKVHEERSPKFRRRRLGQKGVGRFATEKLGRELVLRTRVEQDKKYWQVRFMWGDLQGDRELSDYEFPITHVSPKSHEHNHGTSLEIHQLRLKWKKSHVEKLRSQLCRLIDPETTATDFSIRLETPWPELNAPLVNPLPGNETHRISFEISASGEEIIDIFKDGKDERKKTQGVPLPFGSIRGKIRYFGLGLPKSDRARGTDADADWNIGIRLFRDGCRVRPYGEPGQEGDWLQIYRTRYLRGSRFRLKPHYLEGTIHISADTNKTLRDTTSREGLEQNDSFQALVEYLHGKLMMLSDVLMDEELKEERKRTRERYSKALDPLSKGLGHVKSEEYKRAVEDSDREIKKGLQHVVDPNESKNAHWECLDCLDTWKSPKNVMPSRCRDYSVGRDGLPTRRPGCGSMNIRRKENVKRDQRAPQPPSQTVDDVMAGVPAYISGKQLRPEIDWEMGENDEEAEVRPEVRILAINGRHFAFRAADKLDGNETVEGTALEELRAVAALTIHIINAAACAWGSWHLGKDGDHELYRTKYQELKIACLSSLPKGEDPIKGSEK